MDVLIILVFVSLVLVVGALLLLLVRIRGGDFDHIDRLPFLPLDSDRHESNARAASDPAIRPSSKSKRRPQRS